MAGVPGDAMGTGLGETHLSNGRCLLISGQAEIPKEMPTGSWVPSGEGITPL